MLQNPSLDNHDGTKLFEILENLAEMTILVPLVQIDFTFSVVLHKFLSFSVPCFADEAAG